MQRGMRHDPPPVDLQKPEPLVQPHRAFITLEADQADMRKREHFCLRKCDGHEVGADPLSAEPLVDGKRRDIEGAIQFGSAYGLSTGSLSGFPLSGTCMA